MRYFYSFIASLILTVSAHATDTYYCDTGDDTTGDGSKANPWRTYSKAITNLDFGSAGDRIYFCEGGEFASVSTQINTTCTENNGCYITSYQPDDISLMDMGVRPHIVVPTDDIPNHTGLAFSNNAAYITVSNLHFQAANWTGSGDQTWGSWLYQETSHITYDNVLFQDLAVGINISDSRAPDDPNTKTLIKNSQFINNWSVGILGSSEYYTLIDSYFDRNGSNGGGRPIYLGGERDGSVAGFAHDYLVSGNVMTNSAPSDIGNGDYEGVWEEGMYGCNRDAFGGHGYMQRIMIKNNIVREDRATAALANAGCWAFSIDTAWGYEDERFVDLVFQNNEAYYGGNSLYSCSNCTGVKFIENIGYGINGGSGITAASRAEDAPHPTTSMSAFHNLMVFELITPNGNFGVNGRYVSTTTVIADVQWNVFIFADNDATNYCTSTDVGSTVQNNFCFNVDASGNFVVSTNYATK